MQSYTYVFSIPLPKAVDKLKIKMEGNGKILTPNDLPSSPGETEEGK